MKLTLFSFLTFLLILFSSNFCEKAKPIPTHTINFKTKTELTLLNNALFKIKAITKPLPSKTFDSWKNFKKGFPWPIVHTLDTGTRLIAIRVLMTNVFTLFDFWLDQTVSKGKKCPKFSPFSVQVATNFTLENVYGFKRVQNLFAKSVMVWFKQVPYEIRGDHNDVKVDMPPSKIEAILLEMETSFKKFDSLEVESLQVFEDWRKRIATLNCNFKEFMKFGGFLGRFYYSYKRLGTSSATFNSYLHLTEEASKWRIQLSKFDKVYFQVVFFFSIFREMVFYIRNLKAAGLEEDLEFFLMMVNANMKMLQRITLSLNKVDFLISYTEKHLMRAAKILEGLERRVSFVVPMISFKKKSSVFLFSFKGISLCFLLFFWKQN